MKSTANSNVTIGAVAIGRNEGQRLRACLGALRRDLDYVVYVDSGSTDESRTIARDLGALVVELDTSTGYTAARARNAGFRRLLESPDVEYVQFVDGDCEVVDGWIESAAQFLHEHPDVAVVSGRRRERDPQRNWYHRLTDMEWHAPPGEAKYCGGDAFMRVTAVRQVSGYRESLIAGEEPELCVRLRKAGWRVWRLDREMTWHDIRMSSFRQWWRRAVRSGHAYAEGAALHGAPPERHWVKESRSIWIWSAVLPLVAAILAWPTGGLSLVALLAVYLVQLARMVWRRRTAGGDSFSAAWLYASFCLVAKWPQLVGQLRYWGGRWTKRPAALIEYQAQSEPTPARP